MTAVSVTYILIAPEGFGLAAKISYPAGIGATVILFAVFLLKKKV